MCKAGNIERTDRLYLSLNRVLRSDDDSNKWLVKFTNSMLSFYLETAIISVQLKKPRSNIRTIIIFKYVS